MGMGAHMTAYRDGLRISKAAEKKLKDCRGEIEKIVPIYFDMLHSLNLGETDYQLEDAKDLYMKISKLAERIDAVSKRILKLEAGPEEGRGHTVQLHSSIRMAASQFLMSTVLGLPTPPSEEEIAHYQNIRQERMQRCIELEKLSKTKETSKSKSPSPVATPKQPLSEPVTPDKGWCVTTGRVQEEDPMLQQIKIINKYIQQARVDHKYDGSTNVRK